VRLASVEVIPYALPFREPYVTARGELTRREMVLLRLRSEDGLVGLGEAVPLSLRGGATLAQVVEELTALADSGVLEKAVEGGDAEQADRVDTDLPISAPSACAALTALIDLSEKGEEAGEPDQPGSRGAPLIVRAKHGPGPVPCNATLVAGAPGAVAEDALRWAEAGFSTFKLKLGAGEDVEAVRAVRDALGSEARIRVDANGSWSLEAAKRLLAEIEPFDVELVEQPVLSTEEAATLARATAIPLAGDESVATREDAEWAVELGAYRWTGLKLSKVGGLAAGIAIDAVLPAYVASALDGPVGIAAAAQLAQRLHYEPLRPEEPRLAHGLATQRLFASTIAAVECELRDGMLHLPPGPGLGVEIDEDALAAHRL
jgi:o-succinylbenzoate synthase